MNFLRSTTCLIAFAVISAAQLGATTANEGAPHPRSGEVPNWEQLLSSGFKWPPVTTRSQKQTFSVRGFGECITPMSCQAQEYLECGFRIQSEEGQLRPFLDIGSFESLSGWVDNGMQLWAGTDWFISPNRILCLSASVQARGLYGFEVKEWDLDPSVTLLLSFETYF